MICYRHLPSGEIAAEAWRFTTEEDCPDWLMSRGTGYLSKDAPRLDVRRVSTVAGIVLARPGDWITLDNSGLVDVWTAEDFSTKFTLVEGNPKP